MFVENTAVITGESLLYTFEGMELKWCKLQELV
jgi:hypothetical protein